MFKVNGLTIDVTGYQLLNDLRTNLQQNGIFLLETIKEERNNNIQFTCPVHKSGKEKSPSCGLSTTDVHKNGKIYSAGMVHCFTCGYTATLTEFISYCFGYKDGGLFGNKWIKTTYNYNMTNNSRHFSLQISRGKQVEKQYKTIDDSILDSFAFIHPYMYKRGLTDEIINKFDIGFDKSTNSITFPVTDLKGDVKWIQSRAVNTKYYHIPNGIIKTDFLYGVYEVVQDKYKYAVIVESILNALTLWKYDIPAIALFGTGGGKQYDLLKKLPIRHYIIALDNDEAGRNGTAKLIQQLQNHKLLSRLIYPNNSTKDINDYDEEILK